MKTLVKYLCENIVIGIITESKKVDDFMPIFLKQNKDLQDGILRDLLMRGDPTSVSNDRGDFVGKYGTWIGNMAKEGKLSQDDVATLHDALTIYHANKSKVEKDIKDIASLDELISIVKDLDPNFKPEKTKAKVEQNGDLEKVYDDKFVTVYVPHTYEASRYIGGDTHWCTASSDGGKMFNQYLKDDGGEYYVIIRKKDGDKFQLHVESNQFMNKANEECTFGDIFNNKKDAYGLINFLQKKRNKDIEEWIFFRMSNDELEEFIKTASKKDLIKNNISFNVNKNVVSKEGYSIISYNDKYNWIDEDGKLLTDDWWYYCWHFRNGYACVERKDGKLNWIGKDGKPLTKKWWKNCYNFYDGYAVIERDDEKCNWMGEDKKPLNNDYWWDWCGNFSDGYAKFVFNDKEYYIDTKGNCYNKRKNPIDNPAKK